MSLISLLCIVFFLFPLDFHHVLDICDKILNVRSGCSQMFFKIGFLKNFTICTEKHLCWSLFLIKVFLFFSEYCKIIKNRFNIEYLWMLLLLLKAPKYASDNLDMYCFLSFSSSIFTTF